MPHRNLPRRAIQRKTMLDLIGALCLGASAVLVTSIVIASASMSATSKTIAFMLTYAWLAALVALAAKGVFATGGLGPVPGVPLAFALSTAFGLIAFFTSPRFRAALLSVPMLPLVAVNVFRVEGVFFLILLAQNRVVAQFAHSAGIGDIITGVVAAAIVLLTIAKRPVSNGALAVWNAFGALDLIVAIALGVLTSGLLPTHIFAPPPPNNAVGLLPWLLIPTFLVPFHLLIHLTIATKLAKEPSGAQQRTKAVILSVESEANVVEGHPHLG
jgi:hypothetical protein